MTEEKVQQIVAQAIAETPIERWKYYHVCWWDGQLQCLHVHHTKNNHPIFFAAPGDVFANGLTEPQWRLATTRVLEFCRTQGITSCNGLVRRKRKAVAGRSRSAEKLQITEFDSMRLRALLTSAKSSESSMDTCLEKLQQLLETADTVAPEEVPADVVTMNSQMRLKDEEQDREMTLSLVFPADALRDGDFERMKVSVLTPIGLSLLGRRVGETVEGRIRVQELLYQPEASGDFNL
jgi:regulator of nucleoside diphosphate kinase